MATNEAARKKKPLKPPKPRTAIASPGNRPGTALLAYVLHRYDWSETSLIVELFTRAQGRTVVIAKGAKRPTSQLRPVLLPFQPLQALLGRASSDAQSEVHVLRSAEWAGGQPLLNAAAMFSGFYLNELLLKLLARQDPHPELFDAYADTLAALATASGGVEEAATLRAFELVLLRDLGWLPELDAVTLTTQALQPDRGYTLRPEAGLTEATSGALGATWMALEPALASRRMAQLRATCALEAAALRVPLRELLHYHLGPAPLRTRQVLQGVQRLALTTNDAT
jgi:DNA repair protein RecO (recombination protein O)